MRGWLFSRRDKVPTVDKSDRWHFGKSYRTRVYIAPIVGIAPVAGRAYEVSTFIDGEPQEPQWFPPNLQAFEVTIPEIERRAEADLGAVRADE